MKIIKKSVIDGVSSVYVAETADKAGLVEFVEVAPEKSGEDYEKWVLILSTQIGCPASCLICDAGGSFVRNLEKKEILFQAEYMIEKSRIDTKRVKKFKIQFARMGEPALNDFVIDAMAEMKKKYNDFIPCISSIAPAGREKWFDKLADIRGEFNEFQMQFSIFSTDEKKRDEIIKYPKMNLEWISSFGEKFYREGKRKIILNFPVNEEFPIDIEKITNIFNKEKFIAKFTPINPTEIVKENGRLAENYYETIELKIDEMTKALCIKGFDSIKSIGEMKENIVGSNCGQSVAKMKKKASDDSGLTR